MTSLGGLAGNKHPRDPRNSSSAKASGKSAAGQGSGKRRKKDRGGHAQQGSADSADFAARMTNPVLALVAALNVSLPTVIERSPPDLVSTPLAGATTVGDLFDLFKVAFCGEFEKRKMPFPSIEDFTSDICAKLRVPTNQAQVPDITVRLVQSMPSVTFKTIYEAATSLASPLNRSVSEVVRCLRVNGAVARAMATLAPFVEAAAAESKAPACSVIIFQATLQEGMYTSVADMLAANHNLYQAFMKTLTACVVGAQDGGFYYDQKSDNPLAVSALITLDQPSVLTAAAFATMLAAEGKVGSPGHSITGVRAKLLNGEVVTFYERGQSLENLRTKSLGKVLGIFNPKPPKPPMLPLPPQPASVSSSSNQTTPKS